MRGRFVDTAKISRIESRLRLLVVDVGGSLL